MFLWGIGPVFKAVIKVLKAKIREAEKAFEAHKQALHTAHLAEVARLELERDQAIAEHLEAEVSKIFNGIVK